ncbi:MAG: response regulator transcription factor [Burkholderiaceae bacterium]|nr:response regulator transcription factor [Burkholderiaceae bacterium]
MPSQINILILEDQGLVRAGMRELIRISEPTAIVHEAASYDEAIQVLSAQDIDFAFLDIDLRSPKSGIDVLDYLRERELGAFAIMLSARDERDVILECINLGACGYVHKDMSDDKVFREALAIVLQGGIFLPGIIGGSLPRPPADSGKGRADTLASLGVTGRSAEVLHYICQGLPNKAIARKMNVEEGTIRKDYVPKLFKIFRVARRTELLIEVARRGIKLPRIEKGKLKP